MTQFIIGAVSELDMPKNARQKGASSLAAYYAELTAEDAQKERDEILDADESSIRSLAGMIEDIFDEEHICVIGSESSIDEHSELFGQIEFLLNV